MSWHIIYKGKPIKGTLTDNLESAGVEYYVPKQCVEYYDQEQKRMKIRQEEVARNLIFVNTEADVKELAKSIDGLRRPYIDHATGMPAVISDKEMQRFMKLMEMKNLDAKVLTDPYQHFRMCQKVRVKAGEFEGTEGYVLRMRGDRKLIISLCDMAIAISGIHYSLFQPIDQVSGG